MNRNVVVLGLVLAVSSLGCRKMLIAMLIDDAGVAPEPKPPTATSTPTATTTATATTTTLANATATPTAHATATATTTTNPTATASATAKAVAAADAPTCSGVCARYHRCVGVSDPATIQQCVTECEAKAGGGAAPQFAEMSKMDCTSLVRKVGGLANNKGQQQQGAAKPAKCQGCVWDGSQCIWMSQSNWGPGPYSGAWSSCDPACCGR